MKYKIPFILLRIAQVVTVIILIQTLVFKFWITPEALIESQRIFSAVSTFLFGSDTYESHLRIGSWIIELIMSILLVIPRTVLLWAIGVVWLILWAILLHILVLWFDQLFVMACVVLVCALYIVWYKVFDIKFI